MAQASQCVQGENCVLPDCFCPTMKHPDFTDVKQIPQMVYFGFDDALNVLVDEKYSKLFTPTRLNPNGCPISMSLYISNQDTSYILVNEYYNNGIEIGSHGITHTMIDTAEKLRTEAGEQKNNLATEGTTSY
ncbi:hypothetical protein BaRGS_00012745 [Batillaria attramentaria]|uniref:NodB homology domain-containing protein n=1 Tax=Batillaria attramentaria TaxID=370345 RepID=A0ABD0LA85_9CAEN